MESVIRSSLIKVEEEERVKVLFACETGSRAWGTHSENSDYDIRFIYIRNSHWYLHIYEGRDVIEVDQCGSLELVGWDLKKTLRLLHKSNPTLLEWLNSPIIYRSDPLFTSQLKTLSNLGFSLITTVYHYLNMAKRNYQLVKRQQRFTPKSYLTVLRPLVTCLWLLEKKKMPESDVRLLFRSYTNNDDLLEQLDELVLKKQRNHQFFYSQFLNDYIDETLLLVEEKLKVLPSKKDNKLPINTLNKFFIDTLLN